MLSSNPSMLFMFRNMKGILVLACISLCLPFAQAREDVNGRRNTPQSAGKTFRTAAVCLPSTSSSELDINNVRALIHNGGDMWWDLVSNPRYEIPKVSNPSDARHALFSGSLWIGGIDNSGLLRLAAQTFREGSDFWPGPLRVNGSADTEQDICLKWDRHFKINRTEIDEFLASGTISAGIRNWPAINEDAAAGDFERFLAPFHDENKDLEYNPDDGDYPVVRITSPTCAGGSSDILPNQFIWWVINDNGDVHTSSGGQPLGVEIQMTAFAYSASNAVNDMTFYQEKVFNRSTLSLNNTYMGQWTDADLGVAQDDFAGCDTVRLLAFVYNADNADVPLSLGYGSSPPAIGIDFFQGPFADPLDGVDNDRDGIDEQVERIPMERFVYYNNDASLVGNPSQATQYYNYLIGRWRDGADMVDDRDPASGIVNGYPDPGDGPGNPTDYMFPDYPGVSCAFTAYGTSNSNKWGESENGSQVGVPADKRLLQSAGPFTLRPGAFNELIVGVVWARDQLNQFDVQQFGSVCKMYQADDIAQALFDACFELLEGPDAPNLAIEEYDRQLVLSWQYLSTASNNYYENYAQRDPVLCNANPANCTFNFEGYMVYQLRDGSVTVNDIEDATKARLIAQCDIKNNVTSIVNRESILIDGTTEPVITDRIMVSGNDDGLFHSLSLLNDAFAEGSDDRLVNYRTYYFTIVAYAYNDTSADGRKFIRSSSNVVRYDATPHKTAFENFGTVLNSTYGSGPEITRVKGGGNSGNELSLRVEQESQLLQPPFTVGQPIYQGGSGPIDVRVVNPKSILPRAYEVEVLCDQFLGIDAAARANGQADSANYTDWRLYEVTNPGQRDLVYQSIFRADNTNIAAYTATRALNGQEKLVIQGLGSANPLDHGFSIGIDRSTFPGDTLDNPATGFISGSITYTDPTRKWLGGLPDQDNVPLYNWIRSGDVPINPAAQADLDLIDYWGVPTNSAVANIVKRFRFFDKFQAYEKVINGTWSPYIMAASFHTIKDLIAPRIKLFFNDDRVDGGTFVPAPYDPANGRPTATFEGDPANFVTLDKLPNVDIVITSDPARWSRCVVVETSPNKNLGSSSWIMTAKWRNSLSIQEVQTCAAPGTPSPGSTDYGMSYFPGYAIDLDSGRRLNIFFGESTWHKSENGDDMLWNPTGTLGNDGKSVGGRHYIYVSNTTYDECAQIAASLRVPPTAQLINQTASYISRPLQFQGGFDIKPAWQGVAWTSIPLVTETSNLFRCYQNIPSDARVSLRVKKRMDCGAIFRFDMRPFAVQVNQGSVARQNLDIANIVPNPFYGRSGVGRGRFENDQLDTRVKITNLPPKCTIRIFTLNGALVRVFRKDSPEPSQEWDLKNDFGVPIASGLYILHIDAEGAGEKILKFFCVMPQPDLNAF